MWYLYRQWWWITALLLLACLGALVLYLRTRRQLQELANAHGPAPVTVAVDSETQAWQRLRSACENGDAQSIHAALQDWCQHYWQLSQRPGIAELKATGADQALIVEAQNLEQHLYGKSHREKWNPQALAEAVRQQRASKHRSGRNAQDSHLPPLYQ